jgi:Tfp pilus assembly protein PilF
LAQELGNLPLALAQAGAFMDETGDTLANYLKLYAAHQHELLGRRGATPSSETTVATTWDISFRRVEAQSPAAAQLMNLSAFFAPDEIPKEVIAQGKENLPEPLASAVSDALTFDDAIAALRRYSLVEVSGDGITIHRLVQAVTRDRMTEDDFKTWPEVAVRIVNDSFPGDIQDNVNSWLVCARLLPHALAVSEAAETQKLAPEATGRLLNQVGSYLQKRAQFAEARKQFERAIAIDEAAYGKDHPTVAIDVNNLGLVLRDLGDLNGAKTNYERALKIDEATYGKDHPTVAIDVNNLGSVLQDLGDLDGAKTNFERALRIFRQFLGDEHPNTRLVKRNLEILEEELRKKS